MNLNQLREDYKQNSLSETEVPKEPFELFRNWFEQAMKSQIKDVNAMTLATAGLDGRPSARTVLLKEIAHGGFVFFTNYQSKKSQELLSNPHAALLFFWNDLERQIRIEGSVEKITVAESETYFNSRPELSKAGAIVSPQSQKIPNRLFLEEKLKTLLDSNSELRMPNHWGGFCLIPSYIEFWQGRPGRLHDRIVYEKIDAQSWSIFRLAP